jgi:hypothetical protein
MQLSESMKELGVTEEHGLVICKLLADTNNNLAGAVFNSIDDGREVLFLLHYFYFLFSIHLKKFRNSKTEIFSKG